MADRDSQRANPLNGSEETCGVGPADSARGQEGRGGDASNSTSIVVEVSRIAGPPGIGPTAFSAEIIAMIGDCAARRVNGG